MVAFKKKNTLKQTGFEVNNAGFKYRDRYYKFEDVTGLKILRQVLEHKTFLVGSDFHYSISVIILVKSGDHIQITEQPTLLSDSKTSNIEYIEKELSVIASKSWRNRLNNYINQVKVAGYYDYNGWRFYPQQKQIEHIDKGKIYDLNSISLSKTPTHLIVKKKDEGLGSKFMRSMLGGDVVIDTLMDTDVFFKLLDYFFDIRWS